MINGIADNLKNGKDIDLQLLKPGSMTDPSNPKKPLGISNSKTSLGKFQRDKDQKENPAVNMSIDTTGRLNSDSILGHGNGASSVL